VAPGAVAPGAVVSDASCEVLRAALMGLPLVAWFGQRARKSRYEDAGAASRPGRTRIA
jgi:hypothetical protein